MIQDPYISVNIICTCCSLCFAYMWLSEKTADVIMEDSEKEVSIQDTQLAFSAEFNIPQSGKFIMDELSLGYYKALMREVKKDKFFVPEIRFNDL